ncbi:hypothetical protein EVAR_82013_1 [Eumeta japonica]|uniref:Uncharacterized protein n=1 Tax=Eumeta variegata TaxID=151549 RepID=A0A4C1VUZ6_EUMVA|nr:hypothetical protein EVAR_82013_1 [Eumeta japonica]
MIVATIRVLVVTAAQRHSQLQKCHQRISDLLGKDRISDGREKGERPSELSLTERYAKVEALHVAGDRGGCSASGRRRCISRLRGIFQALTAFTLPNKFGSGRRRLYRKGINIDTKRDRLAEGTAAAAQVTCALHLIAGNDFTQLI